MPKNAKMKKLGEGHNSHSAVVALDAVREIVDQLTCAQVLLDLALQDVDESPAAGKVASELVDKCLGLAQAAVDAEDCELHEGASSAELATAQTSAQEI